MNRKHVSTNASPDRTEELAAYSKGFARIAGVDEAGRGALAGPVVAAAVVLPPDADFKWLTLVRDSKLLQGNVREDIMRLMEESRIEVGVAAISASIIDDVNILNATKRAMRLALKRLPARPDFVLSDAVVLPRLGIAQKAIIKGDRTCLVISCASIVAKVTRDHLMMNLDTRYPWYGFAQHKGYGTSEHLRQLQHHGACRVHRFTFAPVKDLSRML